METIATTADPLPHLQEISNNLGVTPAALEKVVNYLGPQHTSHLLAESRHYVPSLPHCPTPIYDLLISRVGVQLGAAGRLRLKGNISAAGGTAMQHLAHQIAPLKSATVQQLLQISEVVGCLTETVDVIKLTGGPRKRPIQRNGASPPVNRKRRKSSVSVEPQEARVFLSANTSSPSSNDGGMCLKDDSESSGGLRRSVRVKRRNSGGSEDLKPVCFPPPPPAKRRPTIAARKRLEANLPRAEDRSESFPAFFKRLCQNTVVHNQCHPSTAYRYDNDAYVYGSDDGGASFRLDNGTGAFRYNNSAYAYRHPLRFSSEEEYEEEAKIRAASWYAHNWYYRHERNLKAYMSCMDESVSPLSADPEESAYDVIGPLLLA